MTTRNKCNREGFSLLQIATVLMVGTVVLISILPGGDAGDNNQKNITNAQKLDKIEDAMSAFMAVNGRRPCPADGQYDVSSANFGLEAANHGNCTGGTPAAPLGPNNNVVGGVIPTKTLGLPDDYAFDAWSRRFTYVVDRRATIAAPVTQASPDAGDAASCYALQKYPFNNGKGNVTIETSSVGGTVLDHTMYAYISHGPDGHGAWPAQGGAGGLNATQSLATRINIGSTDADTNTNASWTNDGLFTTSFTNVRVKKDKTAAFDDQVYYREDTKNTCCIGAACNQATGFRIDGNAGTTENAGRAVAVGDVNGDGISDLIIAAPASTRSGVTTGGSVYVLFGQRNGGFTDPMNVSGSTLNGINGFRMDGIATTTKIASSLAVGDVNGDGIADIIMGTNTATVNGVANKGQVFVVFGHTGSWVGSNNGVYTLDATASGLIDGVHGFRLDHNPSNVSTLTAYMGLATADINGDGYSDIIIGAPSWNPGFAAPNNSIRGRTLVVFGAATGQWLNANPTGVGVWTLDAAVGGIYNLVDGTHGFQVDSTTSLERAGTTVAGGDINGDGIADLIISAPSNNSNAGAVYVVFGHTGSWSNANTWTGQRTTGTWTLDTDLIHGNGLIDGTKGFQLTGAGAGDQLGSYGITTGDINGDGIQDIIVGAYNATVSGTASVGAAYVIFGTPNIAGVPSMRDGTAWGTSQALSSGAHGAINGTNGFAITQSAALTNTLFGWHVASQDINGDGIQDVILSNYMASPAGRANSGEAWVIFGGAGAWPASVPVATGSNNGSGTISLLGSTGINGSNGLFIEGPSAGAYAGYGLAAGDVNGDGLADVVIGAYGSNSTAGATYVLYGSKTRWSPTPYYDFDLHTLD